MVPSIIDVWGYDRVFGKSLVLYMYVHIIIERFVLLLESAPWT